jgi:hypothetical protein
MRGLLCTEFLEFAAVRFGSRAEQAGGAPCDRASCQGPQHVRRRAEGVAGLTGVPVPLLLQLFGTALFARLVRSYPAFFVGIESTLDLVARFETHVAAEVGQLDPAARLPLLAVVRRPHRPLEVSYRSPHGLADLAYGLLRGSVAHFGESLEIRRHHRGRMGTQAIFRVHAAKRTRSSPSTVLRFQ